MDNTLSLVAICVAIGVGVIAYSASLDATRLSGEVSSLKKINCEITQKCDELADRLKLAKEDIEELADAVTNSVDVASVELLKTWVSEIDKDVDAKFNDLSEKHTYHEKWLKWVTERISEHAKRLKVSESKPKIEKPKDIVARDKKKEFRERSEKYKMKAPRYHGTNHYRGSIPRRIR